MLLRLLLTAPVSLHWISYWIIFSRAQEEMRCSQKSSESRLWHLVPCIPELIEAMSLPCAVPIHTWLIYGDIPQGTCPVFLCVPLEGLKLKFSSFIILTLSKTKSLIIDGLLLHPKRPFWVNRQSLWNKQNLCHRCLWTIWPVFESMWGMSWTRWPLVRDGHMLHVQQWKLAQARMRFS